MLDKDEAVSVATAWVERFQLVGNRVKGNEPRQVGWEAIFTGPFMLKAHI